MDWGVKFEKEVWWLEYLKLPYLIIGDAPDKSGGEKSGGKTDFFFGEEDKSNLRHPYRLWI